jgi:hypothetical protein
MRPSHQVSLKPGQLHQSNTLALTDAGEQVHSYKSLLAELATLTRNTIRLPQTTASFEKLAQPTAIQARALELAEHAPLTA